MVVKTDLLIVDDCEQTWRQRSCTDYRTPFYSSLHCWLMSSSVPLNSTG